MSNETPEQILERARWHEKRAQGAEYLRAKIRLGEKVYEERTTVTRRLIFRDMRGVDETLLSGGEQGALYDALGVVRDREHKAARELRARVAIVNPKELP